MKEEEIAKLLSEGTPPAKLVRQGYLRSTVYKVAGRLRTETSQGGSNGTAQTVDDRDVESDAEVVELKKALRKAELERQIEEIKGPSSIESRLAGLEKKTTSLEVEMRDVMGAHWSHEERLNDSPLTGLRELFECSCGAKGLVAVKLVCTSCNRETSYGWRPERP